MVNRSFLFAVSANVCRIAVLLALLWARSAAGQTTTCSFDLSQYADPDPAWAGYTANASFAWSPVAFFSAHIPISSPALLPCAQGGNVTMTGTVYFGPDPDPTRAGQFSISGAGISQTSPYFSGSGNQTLSQSVEYYFPYGTSSVQFLLVAGTSCDTSRGDLACGGGSRFFSVVSAHVTITTICHKQPTVTGKFDPVPLGSYTKSAVSGNVVTRADTSQLRPVDGVAADGTARVLVEMTGGCTNSSYQISLADENSVYSTDVNVVGDMASPGTSAFATVNTMTTDSTGKGQMVYRAPPDFVTPSNSYQYDYSRSVYIVVGGAAIDEIAVFKPPILLVGGLGGGSVQGFSYFDFARNPPPGWWFTLLSYDATLPLPQQGASIYSESRKALQSFRSVYTAAAAQGDFITVSAGGVLVRDMARNTSYSKTWENFGQGAVHKLITIGSPHLGSDWMLLPKSCLSLLSLFVPYFIQNGAGELTPGSPYLTSLNSAPAGIPTFTLAGSLGTGQRLKAELALSVVSPLCGIPTGTMLSTIFALAPNDFIVSEASARGGVSGVQGQTISGRSHTDGLGLTPTLWAQDYNGSIPVSNDGPISGYIIDAINSHISNWGKM